MDFRKQYADVFLGISLIVFRFYKILLVDVSYGPSSNTLWSENSETLGLAGGASIKFCANRSVGVLLELSRVEILKGKGASGECVA